MSSWDPPASDLEELKQAGVSDRQIDRYAKAFSVFNPSSESTITVDNLKATYSRFGKDVLVIIYRFFENFIFWI